MFKVLNQVAKEQKPIKCINSTSSKLENQEMITMDMI